MHAHRKSAGMQEGCAPHSLDTQYFSTRLACAWIENSGGEYGGGGVGHVVRGALLQAVEHQRVHLRQGETAGLK